MRTLNTLFHLCFDTASALLLSISAGIVLGVIGVAITQRLDTGLHAGVVGCLVAAIALGYGMWRHYAPRLRQPFRATRIALMSGSLPRASER
jgi:hypothetical protein